MASEASPSLFDIKSTHLSKIVCFGGKNQPFFDLKKLLKFKLSGIFCSDVMHEALKLALVVAIKKGWFLRP